MLGFRPLPAADAAAVDPDLEPVNEILRDYETAWDSHVDVWLVIRVPDPKCVYKCDSSLQRASHPSCQQPSECWRLQAICVCFWRSGGGSKQRLRCEPKGSQA